MSRGLLVFLVLFCSSITWAQRTVPNDMDVAILKKVNLPYVELSNGGFSWLKLLTLGWLDGNASTFQVSRFVRIKDEYNRFAIMGKLTIQTGKTVAIKRSDAGVIQEIWLLTEDEVSAFRKQMEAAKQ